MSSQALFPVDEDSVSCYVVEQRDTVNLDRQRGGDANEEDEVPEDDTPSYQEHPRFRTWKKHVHHLYQRSFHIDLVWETPSAILMPYMTVKDHLATQTVLCGTRTGGQEQNYLQFLSVTIPTDTSRLDDEGAGYSDVTGEVGGYGHAPTACGMSIERRMYHDGDVLCTRYMHHNPLVLATASSDHNLYVFDWSQISITKAPNDPDRPRGPLPPNALSDHAGDDERHAYMKRMKLIDDVARRQQVWDSYRGEGQHVLRLAGHTQPGHHLDWNTAYNGGIVSGAGNTIRVWNVGNLSKTADRTVQCHWSATLADESSEVEDTKYLWDAPDTWVAATTSGALYFGDTRQAPEYVEPLCQLSPDECGAQGLTAVAVSPLQPHLFAVATSSGTVAVFDHRRAEHSVLKTPLHLGEATCIQWCPHRANLLATGGHDGFVVMHDVANDKTLFKHAAHTDTITDLHWNWQDVFQFDMLSVDCNAITMWRPRNMFLQE